MKSLLLISLIGCTPTIEEGKNIEDTSYAVIDLDQNMLYVNDSAEDGDDSSKKEDEKNSIVIRPYPEIIFNGPSGFTRCTLVDNMTKASDDKNKTQDVIYGWEESYTSWGVKVLIPAICYYNKDHEDE